MMLAFADLKSCLHVLCYDILANICTSVMAADRSEGFHFCVDGSGWSGAAADRHSWQGTRGSFVEWRVEGYTCAGDAMRRGSGR